MILVIGNKTQRRLLEALPAVTKPHFSQASRKLGISVSTLYDNWVKLCREHKVTFKIFVDGAPIEEILGKQENCEMQFFGNEKWSKTHEPLQYLICSALRQGIE